MRSPSFFHRLESTPRDPHPRTRGDIRTRLAVPLFVVLVALTTPLAGQNPDYVLSITEEQGVAGGTISPRVLLDFTGPGLQGWSWGVCHDSNFLEVEEVLAGAVIATVNNGGPADFYIGEIDPGVGWIVGCVVSLIGAARLDAGTDLEMNIVEYELVGPSGSATVLEFCNTAESSIGEPVSLAFVDENGVTFIPVTISGTQLIGTPPDEFIRGDADGNAVFNGIVDALFILSFQFQGGPQPPCLEAADVDGDEEINGLLDGFYALQHQFNGGPPPPAPYPACGADPDPAGSIGCQVPPCP